MANVSFLRSRDCPIIEKPKTGRSRILALGQSLSSSSKSETKRKQMATRRKVATVANNRSHTQPGSPQEWALGSKPQFVKPTRRAWTETRGLNIPDPVGLMRILADLSHFSMVGGIDFPRVAVIGAQGSGKSATLETISGIPFPSSGGLTTTCPILVRCIRESDREELQLTIAAVINGERTDYQAIAPAQFGVCLNRAMAKVSGNTGNIATDGDYVLVEARGQSVETITFIDLPGYQADNREYPQLPQQIKAANSRMIGQNEETLILHVIPANHDQPENGLASRTAVRESDPNGDRTLNVFTKLDAAFATHPHVEALQIFTREMRRERQHDQHALFHARLGFVVVRNRTHQEREAGVSVDEVAVALLASGPPPDSSNRLPYGLYQKWIDRIDTEIPGADSPTLVLEENVGMECLRQKILHILGARMEFLLPYIVHHLKLVLEHVECKIAHLMYVSYDTDNADIPTAALQVCNPQQMIERFSDRLSASLETYISEIAAFPIDQQTLSSVWDVDAQVRLLIADPEQRTETLSRHADILQSLWQTLRNLLLSDLQAKLSEWATLIISRIPRFHINIVNERMSPEQYSGQIQAHPIFPVIGSDNIVQVRTLEQVRAAAMAEPITDVVHPASCLLEIVHGNVRAAASSAMSDSIARVEQTVIAWFNRIEGQELPDFESKAWYEKAVYAARYVRRNGPASSGTFSSKRDNAYDLTYSIKELYQQSCTQLLSLISDQICGDMRQALRASTGREAIVNLARPHARELREHAGWKSACDNLKNERQRCTCMLHALKIWYLTDADDGQPAYTLAEVSL